MKKLLIALCLIAFSMTVQAQSLAVIKDGNMYLISSTLVNGELTHSATLGSQVVKQMRGINASGLVEWLLTGGEGQHLCPDDCRRSINAVVATAAGPKLRVNGYLYIIMKKYPGADIIVQSLCPDDCSPSYQRIN